MCSWHTRTRVFFAHDTDALMHQYHVEGASIHCKYVERDVPNPVLLNCIANNHKTLVPSQCEEGKKDQDVVCVSESGIWGNLLIPEHLTSMMEKNGMMHLYQEDDNIQKTYIMKDNVKYR